MVTRLENGGAQRQTLQIVRELPRQEFEVALAYGPGGFLDAEADAVDDLLRLELSELQRAVSALGDLRALRQMVAILRPLCKSRQVLVHTHSSKAGILGRVAARFAGAAAVVHTVHGFGFHAGGTAVARSGLIQLERMMRPLTHWTLCVAENDRVLGVRERLLTAARSSVIRSGIEVAKFRRDPDRGAALRAELGIDPGAPVIATVACFKPQKAPLDHLEAFARFRAEHPKAHYIWVGDGEGMGPVRQRLAADPELAAHIHLIGWSDRIVAVLSAADLFLLISLWEGLPRSLLEARAAALPCVVSDVCGNPEAVRDGVHGLVVPPRDPEAAAQALCRLWHDLPLRLELGRQASEDLDGFDAARVTPMHIALYRKLLAPAP
jgi:glycosyltransferase involved in cell wall biosynthesis